LLACGHTSTRNFATHAEQQFKTGPKSSQTSDLTILYNSEQKAIQRSTTNDKICKPMHGLFLIRECPPRHNALHPINGFRGLYIKRHVSMANERIENRDSYQQHSSLDRWLKLPGREARIAWTGGECLERRLRLPYVLDGSESHLTFATSYMLGNPSSI